MEREFDIIVVGGGHAGCEAAAVAARMGCRVALVSFARDTIGAMSCNPAIGGLGKGHLVREVDAFDGLIAKAADAAAIHYRMLNASKGAAVQGPRIQADRALFKAAVHRLLAAERTLTIVEGEAEALRMEEGILAGVSVRTTDDIIALRAAAVVLATGTFLGGRLFCGEQRGEGGRIDERAATQLGHQLRNLGLPITRLKTGTPPRLDGRTIDWARLAEQPSDGEGGGRSGVDASDVSRETSAARWTMSVDTPARAVPQLFCAITRTNAESHAVIRAALDRSPLFSGAIEAAGPRYCPSIEDKIHRFGDRDGHQVFLEPEGLDTHLVYPNGISTSLPADVQAAMVRTMEGLENCVIVTPGYAVEYDHIDPRALDHGLAVRSMPGLYCAGQINGTTGYEEAAAQGLIAGINAARQVRGEAPLLLDRATSYIGVMIDDLVLQGVSEPYRMLTARAEFRLRLRADNAETRLSSIADDIGALSPRRVTAFRARNARRTEARAALARAVTAADYAAIGITPPGDGARRTLGDLLRLPETDWQTVGVLDATLAALPADIAAELAEDAHYAPYLARQEAEIRDLRANDRISLPPTLDYTAIGGLSNEMVEKLVAARPTSLAEASRIRGITPAALSAILVHSRKGERV